MDGFVSLLGRIRAMEEEAPLGECEACAGLEKRLLDLRKQLLNVGRSSHDFPSILLHTGLGSSESLILLLLSFSLSSSPHFSASSRRDLCGRPCWTQGCGVEIQFRLTLLPQGVDADHVDTLDEVCELLGMQLEGAEVAHVQLEEQGKRGHSCHRWGPKKIDQLENRSIGIQVDRIQIEDTSLLVYDSEDERQAQQGVAVSIKQIPKTRCGGW
jgi:hypothetical protein